MRRPSAVPGMSWPGSVGFDDDEPPPPPWSALSAPSPRRSPPPTPTGSCRPVGRSPVVCSTAPSVTTVPSTAASSARRRPRRRCAGDDRLVRGRGRRRRSAGPGWACRVTSVSGSRGGSGRAYAAGTPPGGDCTSYIASGTSSPAAVRLPGSAPDGSATRRARGRPAIVPRLSARAPRVQADGGLQLASGARRAARRAAEDAQLVVEIGSGDLTASRVASCPQRLLPGAPGEPGGGGRGRSWPAPRTRWSCRRRAASWTARGQERPVRHRTRRRPARARPTGDRPTRRSAGRRPRTRPCRRRSPRPQLGLHSGRRAGSGRRPR